MVTKKRQISNAALPESIICASVSEIHNEFKRLSANGFESEYHMVYEKIAIRLPNSVKSKHNDKNQ